MHFQDIENLNFQFGTIHVLFFFSFLTFAKEATCTNTKKNMQFESRLTCAGKHAKQFW